MGAAKRGQGTWDRELGTGKWGAGNWGQQTGDRELGTGNWGQQTGQGTGGRNLGRELGQQTGTWDRELGTGNWGQGTGGDWRAGTGGSKLGTGNLGQGTGGSKLDRELGRESLTHKLLTKNQKLSCSKHLVSQVSQRPESKTKEKAGKRHAHFSPHT